VERREARGKEGVDGLEMRRDWELKRFYRRRVYKLEILEFSVFLRGQVRCLRSQVTAISLIIRDLRDAFFYDRKSFLRKQEARRTLQSLSITLNILNDSALSSL
jgi:hypothetical protein